MTKTPWISAKNGAKEFFETPTTLSTTISISNGNEDGSYRLSYTKLDQSGIMPNSQIDRHNFSFSGDFDVNERLSVAANANYIKTDALGRNSTGYNDNILGMFRQWWQTNVDLNQQRDIFKSTGRNISWNPGSSETGAQPIYWDNPYWTRYKNYQNDSRNRFLGKIELNYKITDWVSVMGRVATDTYNETQEERRAVGSVPSNFGVTRGNVNSGYARREIRSTETNYDLMLNFNKDISDRISFIGLLGTNIRRNEFNSVFASTSGGLLIADLYSLQNGVDAAPNPKEIAEKVGVDGIFTSVSFGLDDTVYLDASLRRDHASTLPDDNSTFYYPSVSSSFVFSRLLDVDAINFGKFRLNYAEVGNAAPFDRLIDTYQINNDIGTSLPSASNNPDLKPERTKSYEAGLEMRFLNDRVGFDLAYYKSNSIDQIINVPISTSTGYVSKLLNAGEIENKGIELGLNLVPIRMEDFAWNMNVNFTKAKNKVVALPEGTQTIQLGRFQGGITIQATKGEPYGVLYGTDYLYDDNGNKLVDPDTGFYMRTPTSNNVIGDTNPDWLMGISNSFTYKDFSFSFLIDFQKGGSLFSLDQYYGEATGLYPNSAFINDLGNPVRNALADGGGFINEGVHPDGTVNDIRVDASEFGAFGYAALPNSEFVYDASYVKLRQVNLTYNMPTSLLGDTFLTGAQISLTGSNLWIIHKNVPYADPEAGLSSGNLQGYLTGAIPTTREYGVNVKLQF
ncbi:MAG TPA: TonB-dependent receptor [Flavobacteriaceae bacterium]|nr:TonB-dependent receptor [Flavobacteriaceae bacterium]